MLIRLCPREACIDFYIRLKVIKISESRDLEFRTNFNLLVVIETVRDIMQKHSIKL